MPSESLRVAVIAISTKGSCVDRVTVRIWSMQASVTAWRLSWLSAILSERYLSVYVTVARR